MGYPHLQAQASYSALITWNLGSGLVATSTIYALGTRAFPEGCAYLRQAEYDPKLDQRRSLKTSSIQKGVVGRVLWFSMIGRVAEIAVTDRITRWVEIIARHDGRYLPSLFMEILKGLDPLYAYPAVDSPPVSTLVVVVDRARNIPNRKTFGKQDAYCIVTLGAIAKQTHIHRRAGQTPQWDDEFRFKIDLSLKPSHLLCQLFADNKTPRLIGEVAIDLGDILNAQACERDEWHDLRCNGKRAGSLRLEVTHYGFYTTNAAVKQGLTSSDERLVEISPPQAKPSPLRAAEFHDCEVPYNSYASPSDSLQSTSHLSWITQPNDHGITSWRALCFNSLATTRQRTPDRLPASSIHGDNEAFDFDWDITGDCSPYEVDTVPFYLEDTRFRSRSVESFPENILHEKENYDLGRYSWEGTSLGDTRKVDLATQTAPERICWSSLSQVDYTEYNSNRAFWQTSIDRAEGNSFPSSPSPDIQFSTPAIEPEPTVQQLTMAGSSHMADGYQVKAFDLSREEVVIDKITSALAVIASEDIYSWSTRICENNGDTRGVSFSKPIERRGYL